MRRSRSDGNQYDDAYVAELLAGYRTTGDQRLRDQVVEHMRPLVVSVARRFAGREPQEDLESEGFLGLIRAVDRFEPERGARFSTFATHLVSGQIRHYLRDRGYLIRQPAWLQELNTRVQRVASELEQRLQRTPTMEELAAAANVSEEGIEELLAARMAAQTVRMEAPSDANDDDYLDVDPDKFRSKDYVTLQLPIEDRVMLESALCKLKDLEKNVLHYFFFQDYNQSEIARHMGISCNYVGYLLRNGLKHMREKIDTGRLSERANSDYPGENSVLDPDTGLYNAEHFAQRLREEVSRAQRFHASVSVCCLRLEDRSDGAMARAAQILRTRTRKADVLARTGEREFCVIFPNTGCVAVQVSARLAEQLHGAIGAPVNVASATFPTSGSSAEELFGAARAGLQDIPFRLPELRLAAAVE